jgi:hypothetical protein
MESRANRLHAGAGRFIATISGSSIEEERILSAVLRLARANPQVPCRFSP